MKVSSQNPGLDFKLTSFTGTPRKWKESSGDRSWELLGLALCRDCFLHILLADGLQLFVLRRG